MMKTILAEITKSKLGKILKNYKCHQRDVRLWNAFKSFSR